MKFALLHRDRGLQPLQGLFNQGIDHGAGIFGKLKRMVTTVWAADAAYLSLKSGASLPMRAVVGFDFY